MYKLIDCGTYPFFIKKSNKYYHCVAHFDGEHKQYKIQNSYAKNLNERIKYSYLKDHLANFDKADDQWSTTFRKLSKHWKNLNKTSYMKEVLQQLKKQEKKIWE